MINNIDDDHYIAELLKQDAKNATKQYELVGIDAFKPQQAIHNNMSYLRLRSRALKPNKSFLRNIIRQTDSHNAALLAKEAEESRVRSRQMNRDREAEQGRIADRERKKKEGRLTPVLSDEDSHVRSSRRRSHESDDEDRRKRRRRTHNISADYRDRKHHSEESRSHKGNHHDSDEERPKRRLHRSEREHRDRRRRCSEGDEDNKKPRRKHDSHREKYWRDRSRTRSPSSTRHTSRKPHRDTSYSPRHRSRCHARPRSRSSSSDPLEALLGPLPPPTASNSRPRGRGAHTTHSTTIDSRFSSSYDPTADIRLPSDEDAEDKWGDAVEAFRDRARWKAQGAERLKAAGFTEAEVRKSEGGVERGWEDVRWRKKEEGVREWDRGKVIDGDGVSVRAEWGRLT